MPRSPFVTPASEPGSIHGSPRRLSRWRAGRTAEATARTEAGPRLGGRGDPRFARAGGWRKATRSHRKQICESGRRSPRARRQGAPCLPRRGGKEGGRETPPGHDGAALSPLPGGLRPLSCPPAPGPRPDGRKGRDTAALFAALRLASRLPLALLYPVGRLLAPLARAALPGRRRVAARNLAAVFPGAAPGPLKRRVYAAAADVAMESVRLMSMPKAELGARVRVEGAEALEGGGALLLTAHHGNMLWAVSALTEAVGAPLFVVYKEPHGAVLHRMLNAIGDRFEGTLVPLRKTRREVLRCRQENGVLVLVADQRPGSAERREVEFCGRRTPFFTGRTASAARSAGRPITCPAGAPGGAAISAGSRSSANRPTRRKTPASWTATPPGWRPISAAPRKTGCGSTSAGGTDAPARNGPGPARQRRAGVTLVRNPD